MDRDLLAELYRDLRELSKNDDNLFEIRELVDEATGTTASVDIKLRLLNAFNSACWYGQLGIVTYFVEELGYDVELKDSEGDTALHNACFMGDRASLQVVKFLVGTAGSDVHARNSAGETPLHYACAPPRLDIVSYLVDEAGVDVNAPDKDGDPALFYALGKDEADHDLVRYLIPKTILTPRLFMQAWDEKSIPSDIKELFVKTYYAQQHETSERPNDYYWSRFPLHAALSAPIPSERALFEFSETFCGATTRTLSYMDCDGRLPIHVAIETSCGGNVGAAAVARIIASLMEREPRSVFVRDPVTRFYPFQMAATTLPAECDDDHRHRHNLSLVYELFRCNPEQLRRSNGNDGSGPW